MNRIDLIRLSLKNFLRRKVRTILTILGVIIGTASIVVMLSLGIGMNESFKQQVKAMGSLNVITVDKYSYVNTGDKYGGQMKTVTLDDKAVKKFAAIKGVEAVTPIMRGSLKFGAGKYVAYVNVIGIDPSVMEKFEFKLAEGRLLNKNDTNAVVFGSQLPMQFYNPKNMNYGFYGGMNQKPAVNLMTEKIVMTTNMEYGEKRRGSIAGGDTTNQNQKPAKIYNVVAAGMLAESNDEKSWSAYMNIEFLKKLLQENVKNQSGKMVYNNPSNGYEQILVRVKDFNDVERVQKEIKEMGFGSNSLMDILKSMQNTSKTLQLILGGIGAISLLVAALGIANTMIMSIYERTREIGIMKVLGCLLGDIRKMFLFEAGLIGFLGGLTGLLFSVGTSFLLNTIGGGVMGPMGFGGGMGPNGQPVKISVIPVWLALSSIGFATLVGLISGFYPARRAMKISALEAIKTE